MTRWVIAILCLLWAGAASAQDAVDLSTAVVHNSPADVASWARTTKITQVTMLPENSVAPGLSFEFSARATWPNYTPPGWDGPLQYTVWAGVQISGVWHVSGIIQMWKERSATGAPILTNNNFARNWVYDQRWGAMQGYQPVAGEAMIFFVTAGNARGISTLTSVRERSNVVMVNLPANDNGVFRFATRQTDLVINFGAGGIWTLKNAATFSQISAAQPRNMVTGDLDGNGIDEVIADFGPGLGIWVFWNASTWRQLYPLSSISMGTGDLDKNGRLEVVFGFPEIGTWAFANGSTWWKLNDQAASHMVFTNNDGGGQDLILDFAGVGLLMFRNASAWFPVHPMRPTAMAAGDFDGNGIGDVAFAFPGAGVWMLMNGSTWVQVHSRDAVHLAAGDVDGNRVSDLIADFGPGAGIWMRPNNGAWYPVHGTSSQQIVLGDLDGNGQDDIIINFGNPYGVWILGNLSTWIHATSTSPEQIVVGAFN